MRMKTLFSRVGIVSSFIAMQTAVCTVPGYSAEINEADFWNEVELENAAKDSEKLLTLTLSRNEAASTIAKLASQVLRNAMGLDSIDRVEETPVLARIHNKFLRMQALSDKYGDFSMNTIEGARAVYNEYKLHETVIAGLLRRDGSRRSALKIIRLMVEIQSRIVTVREDTSESDTSLPEAVAE